MTTTPTPTTQAEQYLARAMTLARERQLASSVVAAATLQLAVDRYYYAISAAQAGCAAPAAIHAAAAERILTAATAAEAIASCMHDGTSFHAADGASLEELCEAAGARRTEHGTEAFRWTFPDGSAICEGGCAWDLGFPAPASCACWASVGEHEEGCPDAEIDSDEEITAVTDAPDSDGEERP